MISSIVMAVTTFVDPPTVQNVLDGVNPIATPFMATLLPWAYWIIGIVLVTGLLGWLIRTIAQHLSN